MSKHIYSTESQSFSCFESEKEEEKYKDRVSLKIKIGDAEIKLYDFFVIEYDGKPDFAYKPKTDITGKKIMLYYATDKTSKRFLEIVFNQCKKEKITPVDIVPLIKSGISEKNSIIKAKALKLKKKKNGNRQ